MCELTSEIIFETIKDWRTWTPSPDIPDSVYEKLIDIYETLENEIRERNYYD